MRIREAAVVMVAERQEPLNAASLLS